MSSSVSEAEMLSKALESVSISSSEGREAGQWGASAPSMWERTGQDRTGTGLWPDARQEARKETTAMDCLWSGGIQYLPGHRSQESWHLSAPAGARI